MTVRGVQMLEQLEESLRSGRRDGKGADSDTEQSRAAVEELLLEPTPGQAFPLLCGLSASPITRFVKMQACLDELIAVTKCRLVTVTSERRQLERRVRIPTMISLSFYSDPKQRLLHQTYSEIAKDVYCLTMDMEEIILRSGTLHRAEAGINANNSVAASLDKIKKGVHVSFKNSMRTKLQKTTFMSTTFIMDCRNCRTFLLQDGTLRKTIQAFVGSLHNQHAIRSGDNSYSGVAEGASTIRRNAARWAGHQDPTSGGPQERNCAPIHNVEEFFRQFLCQTQVESEHHICFFLMQLLLVLETVALAMHQLESCSIGESFNTIFSMLSHTVMRDAQRTNFSFIKNAKYPSASKKGPYDLYVLPYIQELKRIPLEYLKQSFCQLHVRVEGDNPQEKISFPQLLQTCDVKSITRDEDALRVIEELDTTSCLFTSAYSTRLLLLIRLLEEAIAIRETTSTEPHSKFRGIVFVDTKATAQHVYNALYHYSDDHGLFRRLNPAVFWGQTRSKDTVGMTKAEQTSVLNRFRAADVKLLIATSVAEEGLDIPNCSLVVRYDACVTLRDVLQTRGRARQLNSLFFLLTNLAFAESRLRFITSAIRQQDELIGQLMRKQQVFCDAMALDKTTRLVGGTDGTDREGGTRPWQRDPAAALLWVQSAYGVKVLSTEKFVFVGLDTNLEGMDTTSKKWSGGPNGQTVSSTPYDTRSSTVAAISVTLLVAMPPHKPADGATAVPLFGKAIGNRVKARKAAALNLCKELQEHGYFDKPYDNTVQAAPQVMALERPVMTVGDGLVFCSGSYASRDTILRLFPQCRSLLQATPTEKGTSAEAGVSYFCQMHYEPSVWSRLTGSVVRLLKTELQRLRVADPVTTLVRKRSRDVVVSMVRLTLQLNRLTVLDRSPVPLVEQFCQQVQAERAREAALGKQTPMGCNDRMSRQLGALEPTPKVEDGVLARYKNTVLRCLPDTPTKVVLEITEVEPYGLEKASLAALQFLQADVLDGVEEVPLLLALIEHSSVGHHLF
ncbi:hypothetical protein AGDE_13590 [Angomonas deanei]|nr:hypothetical protein AGDE_13590 [Angomonas deanei]|eukprot:EPY22116.1 hypothetical protein AGDE_13590 [Angomonas deanei]